MVREEWIVPQYPQGEIAALCAKTDLLPAMVKVLWQRDCRDAKAISDFLSRSSDILYDPFAMTDMDRAVAVLKAAISDSTHITIYGDYDVDGVSGTAMLYRYLSKSGAVVDCYIPHRETDGYGLNCAAIDRLQSRGTQLIVTVDNGAVAFDEAEYIYKCGMRLLITDHHTCTEQLPRCEAFLNPHRSGETYPFADLAGAGVVFKLLCAMETADIPQREDKMMRVRTVCMKYSLLAMLGTVADVMPLRDENRLIVSIGLREDPMQWLGFASLLYVVRAAVTKKGRAVPPLTAGFVSFFLAPRLNAAGRLASADLALSLLLCDSLQQGDALAQELCTLNEKRQEIETEILRQAEEQIRTAHDLHEERILILSSVGWNPGVIGIVASRITEKYRKPTILIAFPEDAPNAVGHGSGRSVDGFSLIDAIRSASVYLQGCGGHALAAGLTIKKEDLPAFCAAMLANAQPFLPPGIPLRRVTAACELSLDEVTLPLAQQLSTLEPYGCANPSPLFVARNVTLTEILPVGDGKHTKFRLRFSTRMLTAMYFGHSPSQLPFVAGDEADLLFAIDINHYGGQDTVQLLVKGIAFPKEQREAFAREMEPFFAFWRDVPDDYFALIPNREEFALLYRHLRATAPLDTDYMQLSRLLRISGPVVATALCCFEETGLLEPFAKEDPILSLNLREHHGKVDLFGAPSLSKIRTLLKTTEE